MSLVALLEAFILSAPWHRLWALAIGLVPAGAVDPKPTDPPRNALVASLEGTSLLEAPRPLDPAAVARAEARNATWTERMLAGMGDAERRAFVTYQGEYRAAAQDPARQRAASESYFRNARPGVLRDNVGMALADESAAAGDLEVAADLYGRLANDAAGGAVRRLAGVFEAKTLISLGKRGDLEARQKAEAFARAIPQAGVGGLTTPQQVADASLRSELLVQLGLADEARQSFLSQSPDPTRPGIRRRYVSAGYKLFNNLQMYRPPAEALAFGRSFSARYPEAVRPDFLAEMALSAEDAGRADLANQLVEEAVRLFPDSPTTANLLTYRATRALEEGDEVTAVNHLRQAVDAREISMSDLEYATEALRKLNVPDPPAAIEETAPRPVPDPGFPAPRPE